MGRGQFEEIFEECLSALLEGRRGIEESLSLYPAWRGRLEPLLRAAEEIAGGLDVSPPPYTRERGLQPLHPPFRGAGPAGVRADAAPAGAGAGRGARGVGPPGAARGRRTAGRASGGEQRSGRGPRRAGRGGPCRGGGRAGHPPRREENKKSS